MAKIISIHSFRGGTGKTNICANLAYLLFSEGKKVGVIDGDIASPGIHILFGLEDHDIGYALNDYLANQCSIQEVAIDVTKNLSPQNEASKLCILPSRLNAVEIAKILREGYNTERLIDGFYQIIDELQLDYLIIDTHPGVQEETLLSMSISDILFIILRPDSQDYQGTAVAVELAKKLDIPEIYLIVNKIASMMDIDHVREKIKHAYEIPVIGTLPLDEKMIAMGSSALFVKKNPDHPITHALKSIIENFIKTEVM